MPTRWTIVCGGVGKTVAAYATRSVERGEGLVAAGLHLTVVDCSLPDRGPIRDGSPDGYWLPVKTDEPGFIEIDSDPRPAIIRIARGEDDPADWRIDCVGPADAGRLLALPNPSEGFGLQPTAAAAAAQLMRPELRSRLYPQADAVRQAAGDQQQPMIVHVASWAGSVGTAYGPETQVAVCDAMGGAPAQTVSLLVLPTVLQGASRMSPHQAAAAVTAMRRHQREAQGGGAAGLTFVVGGRTDRSVDQLLSSTGELLTFLVRDDTILPAHYPDLTAALAELQVERRLIVPGIARAGLAVAELTALFSETTAGRILRALGPEQMSAGDIALGGELANDIMGDLETLREAKRLAEFPDPARELAYPFRRDAFSYNEPLTAIHPEGNPDLPRLPDLPKELQPPRFGRVDADDLTKLATDRMDTFLTKLEKAGEALEEAVRAELQRRTRERLSGRLGGPDHPHPLSQQPTIVTILRHALGIATAEVELGADRLKTERDVQKDAIDAVHEAYRNAQRRLAEHPNRSSAIAYLEAAQAELLARAYVRAMSEAEQVLREGATRLRSGRNTLAKFIGHVQAAAEHADQRRDIAAEQLTFEHGRGGRIVLPVAEKARDAIDRLVAVPLVDTYLSGCHLVVADGAADDLFDLLVTTPEAARAHSVQSPDRDDLLLFAPGSVAAWAGDRIGDDLRSLSLADIVAFDLRVASAASGSPVGDRDIEDWLGRNVFGPLEEESAVLADLDNAEHADARDILVLDTRPPRDATDHLPVRIQGAIGRLAQASGAKVGVASAAYGAAAIRLRLRVGVAPRELKGWREMEFIYSDYHSSPVPGREHRPVHTRLVERTARRVEDCLMREGFLGRGELLPPAAMGLLERPDVSRLALRLFCLEGIPVGPGPGADTLSGPSHFADWFGYHRNAQRRATFMPLAPTWDLVGLIDRLAREEHGDEALSDYVHVLDDLVGKAIGGSDAEKWEATMESIRLAATDDARTFPFPDPPNVTAQSREHRLARAKIAWALVWYEDAELGIESALGHRNFAS